MTDKPRWPLADAEAVAAEIVELLSPACERIIIAGSIRRGKPDVGDVEILYIPRWEDAPGDLFDPSSVAATDAVLEEMLDDGELGKRLSSAGHPAWGEKNKLAIHIASGIPVDLFAADRDNWWNYLVCRTGPAESNMRIAATARKRGFQWNPYGSGFRDLSNGKRWPVSSEREVFEFVGLPVPEWCS